MIRPSCRSFVPFLVLALLLGGCGSDLVPVDSVTDPVVPSVHPAFVTDAQGRALILHGTNVSSSAKDDPGRMPWIDQPQAARLSKDWGFNGVRFLIFWDAVEPQPGQYDDDYLDRVAQRVDWLTSAGILVILDMHQDVYGKFSSTGKALGFDGAPAWAAQTDGLPHRIITPWSLTYLQAGVRRAFDNFWDDEGPYSYLQEHYAAMWAHVVKRFKNHPGVLGYNIMNEPFAGTAAAGNLGGIVFGDAEASLEFQRGRFWRFNDRMIKAIREVDPDGWIFFDPLAFPVNNGGPSELPPLNDPRSGEKRLVYFPHQYAALPEINNYFDPDDTPELDDWVEQRKRDLEIQATPMMIGEFGFTSTGNGRPLAYMARLLDEFDALTSGWMHWSHDPGSWGIVDGADRHETAFANLLARPYPQRVAGFPVEYGYSAETRTLHLRYADRTAAGGPSELYLPRRAYPNGWELQIDDTPGSWSTQWDAGREVLSVTVRKTGGVHELRVVPKP